MNVKLLPVLAVGLMSAAPAFSAPVTLDFEGVTSYDPVGNYYSGLGITFGLDALAFSNDPDFPNYSNAPTPGTIMGPILPPEPTPSSAALNVASGFSGQASFWYSSTAATTVDIFSGLDGTGTVLGTFFLAANAQDGCSDTLFCNWDQLTVSFAGIAQSIQFGSAAGVAGFDDVTVAPVPLPAAAWLLLSGLSGLGLVRRKRSA